MRKLSRLFMGYRSLGVMVAATLFLVGCEPAPEQMVMQGRTMGTTYNVKYITTGDDVPEPDALQQRIDELLEQVNDQMSTYRPNSELSRFNQHKSSEPFPVAKETELVIREAMRLNELTLGALDVTVGPLVNLWGFGPEARPDVVPSDEELQVRREQIGIEHLKLEPGFVSKSLPELYVDLSTIAKGYGVDVIADYIESQGIQDYMVEIGGELRLKGHNLEGQGWRIAIEKPSVDERAIQLIVQPGDMAIATSGDYRNYFERDGIRYSHIINPKTGKPIAHKVVSVTALHPSSMTADGLATGLMVLGHEQGIEVANQYDLAVYMVVKTDDGFAEVYSDAFATYMKK